MSFVCRHQRVVVGGSASRDDVLEYSAEQFTERGKVERYQQPAAGSHEGSNSVRARILRAIGRALVAGPERYTSDHWKDQERGQPENNGQWVRQGKNIYQEEVQRRGARLTIKRLKGMLNSVVEDSLGSLQNSTPRMAKAYQASVLQVMDSLTKESCVAVLSHLTAVNFYRTRAQIIDAAKQYGGIPDGAIAFVAQDGSLHLNGAEEDGQASNLERHVLYAHEFSHLIDFGLSKKKNSQSESWISAWKSEIADGMIGQRFPQATENGMEGWAYFGELALTKPEIARIDAPRCYEHWKLVGLIA